MIRISRIGRRGVTLIELLFAFLIFSIIAVLIYKFLIAGARTGTVAAWQADMNTRLNNLDSRIRQYLEASSYAAVVSPQGTKINKTEDWYLKIPAGIGSGTTPQTVPINEGVIMEWNKCKQGYQGVEGFPDRGPSCTHITLELRSVKTTLKGNIPIAELWMKEESLSFEMAGVASQPDSPDTELRLIPDVSEITVGAFFPKSRDGAVALPQQGPAIITLNVVCAEPTQGQLKIKKEISAESNVGVTQ